ncbi:UDP-N-acetylmuramyl peptide synthase [Bifidobacterium sp. DSM 109958]|uniref:UDP-N-acetylmuramyl peptide synthase n=1 Tax=Bifidobacterium moraviense TaxID=2675323 RepID=A0A7Y0F2N6_9BIFI|nr:UDP-N-acetylmuramyl peptide synthase [Bifidobacterium sp. DSM 109958]NMN00897.1 UDP-N-acetylmuramyl peptide synthase [Bifidobacterium sp. DSM 109958]
MSAVNEALAQRITLGALADRYGLMLDPPFASPVTVTSLADELDDIRPGSLYMPADADPTTDLVRRASLLGAYAVLAPGAVRGTIDDPDIPVLYGDLDGRQVGGLAAWMAGEPSDGLAMFGVVGPDGAGTARALASFLHVLGNPVGRIGAGESYSLDRDLSLDYPLDSLDVQHVLSVCAEDGAAAAVLSVDDATLRGGTLGGVKFDVLAVASTSRMGVDEQRRILDAAARRYGFRIDDDTHVAWRTSDSDALAQQSGDVHDPVDVARLSCGIAMVMAAGVRRSNIRSALRVSHELS